MAFVWVEGFSTWSKVPKCTEQMLLAWPGPSPHFYFRGYVCAGNVAIFGKFAFTISGAFRVILTRFSWFLSEGIKVGRYRRRLYFHYRFSKAPKCCLLKRAGNRPSALFRFLSFRFYLRFLWCNCLRLLSAIVGTVHFRFRLGLYPLPSARTSA